MTTKTYAELLQAAATLALDLRNKANLLGTDSDSDKDISGPWSPEDSQVLLTLARSVNQVSAELALSFDCKPVRS